MTTWRRLILALFPEERRWIQEPDNNYYQLYFELLPRCREAHAIGDHQTLRKIYAHAEWCLGQKERASDLHNAI